MHAVNIGIAGEVRCTVTGVNGEVKTDTGYQKNLILNQGLDFFGGGNGGSMFSKCVIGAGNSSPDITQVALDSFLAIASGVAAGSSYSYTPDASNEYKTYSTYSYTFSGLNNVTISEVGLVSNGSTSADYYLCTRALIKDNSGVATSITVLQGEILTIHYRLWRVVSTLTQNYVIDVSDGVGGLTPYNVAVKPVTVGNANYWGTIGISIQLDTRYSFYVSTTDNSAVNSAPTYQNIQLKDYNNKPYVTNSYKRGFYINASITQGNAAIRSIWTDYASAVPFQVRFGSVADDSPLLKTGTHSLNMNFEFSWGRYEGEL